MNRLVLAFAAVAVALPIGASAAQSWESVTIQTALAALESAPPALGTPRVAMARIPARPDATPTKFLTNFVTVGPAQTGVPCYACVKGAQTTFNVGLTGPYNYISTTETAQYVLSFSNITNTASCTLSWAIAAGKTVIDKFSYVLKAPKAGSTYVYGINRNRPKFSGAAVVAGKVECTWNGEQTVTAPLIFQ